MATTTTTSDPNENAPGEAAVPPTDADYGLEEDGIDPTISKKAALKKLKEKSTSNKRSFSRRRISAIANQREMMSVSATPAERNWRRKVAEMEVVLSQTYVENPSPSFTTTMETIESSLVTIDPKTVTPRQVLEFKNLLVTLLRRVAILKDPTEANELQTTITKVWKIANSFSGNAKAETRNRQIAKSVGKTIDKASAAAARGLGRGTTRVGAGMLGGVLGAVTGNNRLAVGAGRLVGGIAGGLIGGVGALAVRSPVLAVKGSMGAYGLGKRLLTRDVTTKLIAQKSQQAVSELAVARAEAVKAEIEAKTREAEEKKGTLVQPADGTPASMRMPNAQQTTPQSQVPNRPQTTSNASAVSMAGRGMAALALGGRTNTQTGPTVGKDPGTNQGTANAERLLQAATVSLVSTTRGFSEALTKLNETIRELKGLHEAKDKGAEVPPTVTPSVTMWSQPRDKKGRFTKGKVAVPMGGVSDLSKVESILESIQFAQDQYYKKADENSDKTNAWQQDVSAILTAISSKMDDYRGGDKTEAPKEDKKSKLWKMLGLAGLAGLAAALRKAIFDKLKKVGDTLKGIFSVKKFMGILGITKLLDVVSKFGGKVMQMIKSVGTKLSGITDKVKTMITGIGTKLATFVSDTAKAAKDITIAGFDKAVDTAKAVVTAGLAKITDFFKTMGSRLTSFQVPEFLRNPLTAAGNVARSAVNAVQNSSAMKAAALATESIVEGTKNMMATAGRIGGAVGDAAMGVVSHPMVQKAFALGTEVANGTLKITGKTFAVAKDVVSKVLSIPGIKPTLKVLGKVAFPISALIAAVEGYQTYSATGDLKRGAAAATQSLVGMGIPELIDWVRGDTAASDSVENFFYKAFGGEGEYSESKEASEKTVVKPVTPDSDLKDTFIIPDAAPPQKSAEKAASFGAKAADKIMTAAGIGTAEASLNTDQTYLRNSPMSDAETETMEAIKAAEKIIGIDVSDDAMMKKAKFESNFGQHPDTNVSTKKKSAVGLFQIQPKTLEGLRKNHPEFAEYLTDPKNKIHSAVATLLLRMEADNNVHIRKKELSEDDYYFYHNLGGGVAPGFIDAADDTPIKKLVSDKVISDNPALYKNAKTKADAVAAYRAKVGSEKSPATTKMREVIDSITKVVPGLTPGNVEKPKTETVMEPVQEASPDVPVAKEEQGTLESIWNVVTDPKKALKQTMSTIGAGTMKAVEGLNAMVGSDLQQLLRQNDVANYKYNTDTKLYEPIDDGKTEWKTTSTGAMKTAEKVSEGVLNYLGESKESAKEIFFGNKKMDQDVSDIEGTEKKIESDKTKAKEEQQAKQLKAMAQIASGGSSQSPVAIPSKTPTVVAQLAKEDDPSYRAISRRNLYVNFTG